MTSREPRRNQRKREQVLDAACLLFPERGFRDTSMEAIARAANVSKATLYSYFTDKQALFSECIRMECIRQATAADAVIDRAACPAAVLRQAAHVFLGFLLSPFSVRMFRIVIAETERCPDLGRAYYQSGPMLMRERLASYFREAHERGELDTPYPEQAAEQFAELCKADLWNRAIFGVSEHFTEDEITARIKAAVTTFMSHYGRGYSVSRKSGTRFFGPVTRKQ